LAPKGIFDLKFGPLNFFDQNFGPLVKKVGHPWSKTSSVKNINWLKHQLIMAKTNWQI
jgi:hypothetical protein